MRRLLTPRLTHTINSRDFNQGTGAAKRAARHGPVYITNRGKPSHVLLSYDHYRKLVDKGPNIIDMLGEPPGIADVDFNIPRLDDVAKAVFFE